MSPIIIAILALAVVIAVCIVIKMMLRQKLENIDGFNGVHTEDKTRNEETVIGHFGNDT